MSESDSPLSVPEGIGSTVPYFFYDLIGRIIPGAFVIIGSLVCLFPNGLMSCLEDAQKSPGGPEAGIVILGAISFLFASYFVGFFLGALSFPVEDACLQIWPWKDTDIPAELRDANGDQESKLGVRILGECFTIDKTKKTVEDFSRVCVDVIWEISPALGAIGTRWDAEALAARSVFVASVVLWFWALEVVLRWHVGGRLPVIFGLVAVASGMQYRFIRKQHILRRFESVIALRHRHLDIECREKEPLGPNHRQPFATWLYRVGPFLHPY
jgi:hypothetical protein